MAIKFDNIEAINLQNHAGTNVLSLNSSNTNALFSGNVGIGMTGTPSGKLHVKGSPSGASPYALTVGVNIESDEISGINILSPNDGYGRIYFGAPISNTAGAVEYIHNATAASGYMKLRAGGGDQVFILGTGKVGIGTGANVDEKLHIQGSIDNDDIAIKIENESNDGSASTPPSAAVLFQTASSNGYVRVFGAPAHTAANHKMDIGSTAGASYLTFSPSTTEKMRIASNGYVGIGQTDPSRLLHLKADSAAAIITLQRGNVNSSGSYGALQWTASDNHTVSAIDARADGNNEGAHLLFHTTSAASADNPYGISERMRITSDGNVEIGDKNYAYSADNYHIALKSTVSSQDQTTYLSNIEGTMVISAGGYYYGSARRQLNASNTIYGGLRLAEDGDFRLESISGATAGSNTAEASTTFNVNSTGVTTSYGTYIRSQYDGNNYAQIENNSGGGVLKAVDGGSTTVMFRSYGDSYITNDLILGGTSPDEKFHVVGNARVTSRLYNTQHTSSSLFAGNWYRIVEITGGSGRGKCEFSIGGGGSNGTPSLVKATVNTAWNNANSTIKVDFNSKSSAFSEFRVVRNSSSNRSFVDVKLGGAEDSVLLQVYPIAWDSAYAVDFTQVTTLPSGDSVETSVPLTNTAFAIANNNGSDVDPVFKVDMDSKVHAEEFIGQRVIVNGNAYHGTTNTLFALYSTGAGMSSYTGPSNFYHAYAAIIMPFNGVVEKVIIKNVRYSSYTSGPSASGTAKIQLGQYDSSYAPKDYDSGNVSFTAAANVSMTFSPNEAYNEGTHFRVFFYSSAVWRYITYQIILKQTS